MHIPPLPRGALQHAANVLLVLALATLAWQWLTRPTAPHLDKLVVKQPLGDNTFLYGARDNRGGATTGFSYRYYVQQDAGDDAATLEKLAQASAFLVADDDAVKAEQGQDSITIKVNGRVFDYRSDALVAAPDHYRQVRFSMIQTAARP